MSIDFPGPHVFRPGRESDRAAYFCDLCGRPDWAANHITKPPSARASEVLGDMDGVGPLLHAPGKPRHGGVDVTQWDAVAEADRLLSAEDDAAIGLMGYVVNTKARALVSALREERDRAVAHWQRLHNEEVTTTIRLRAQLSVTHQQGHQP